MYGKIFPFFPLFSDTNASIVGSNTECWLIAVQIEFIDFTHEMTTEFLVIFNKLCKYNGFSLVFRLRKKVHLHVNSIAGMTDVQQKKKSIFWCWKELYLTLTFFFVRLFALHTNIKILFTQSAFEYKCSHLIYYFRCKIVELHWKFVAVERNYQIISFSFAEKIFQLGFFYECTTCTKNCTLSIRLSYA